MFFNSSELRVLEAGAKLTWAQQELHVQNISNIETPEYKAKSIQFDDVLKSAMESSSTDKLRVKILTDESASILPNGNNVDMTTENIGLYKSYAQFSMLIDSIGGHFEKYGYVLNSNLK